MELQPMGLPTAIRINAADVTTRLHELDLQREDLLQAIHFGVTYAAECTQHDPSGAAGYLLWVKGTRKLRDILIPAGWDVSAEQNPPLTVHPSGLWAICVASGDACTGIPEQTPATRYDRGPATQRIVSINQLSFSALSPDWARPDSALVRQTWFLLHYRDDRADEVRVELSLPAEMAPDGYVRQWKERIILGVASDDPVVTRSVSDDTFGSGSDVIDIPVLKKA